MSFEVLFRGIHVDPVSGMVSYFLKELNICGDYICRVLVGFLMEKKPLRFSESYGETMIPTLGASGGIYSTV